MRVDDVRKAALVTITMESTELFAINDMLGRLMKGCTMTDTERAAAVAIGIACEFVVSQEVTR